VSWCQYYKTFFFVNALIFFLKGVQIFVTKAEVVINIVGNKEKSRVALAPDHTLPLFSLLRLLIVF
jgi:hypothetical protein